MKALIFGSNGQDGFYLKNYLSSINVDTYCVSRNNAEYLGDIRDFEFVCSIVKEIKPDYVFHFAAVSSTSHDFLFLNHDAISTGTINILEACRLYSKDARVFLSGSGLQFMNTGQPINENTWFSPSSAYAVSRIHSVYAGRYYQQKFNLSIYIGYFFNHDSPLRSEKHINQKIISFIKRISDGYDEKLEIGNINVKKEFSFAGDIVKAVWLLVNQDQVFEAVIGSGVAHSLKEWLEYSFNKIGKNWEDYVIIDRNYTSEYSILVSDPTLIKRLGWAPEYDMNKLCDLMWSGKA